jgi:hypothetical protein
MTSQISTQGKTPNPWDKYQVPENLLADIALPVTAKCTLLEQWKLDLTQLQAATEENMPRTDESEQEKNADMLQRVSNALLKLQPECPEPALSQNNSAQKAS